MSSECAEEEDQPGESLSDLEERFILQHNLRPGVPTVRLPRHIVSDQTVSQPTIARQPSRGPPPPRPSMTPGLPWPGSFSQDTSGQSSPGWQAAGFQPWLSEVDKLRLSGGAPATAGPHLGFPFMAGPSHSSHPASAFTRPGFSTQTPREFLQRPDRIQPGFDRPLGPPGPTQTEIHHVTPEPGEVTIEKCEPWTPSPAPAPPTPTSTPPRQSPSRPSPPARRMRLRDILTSAVRSALGNQELDQEADRFNTEIGATFMNALGPVVKKEK